MLQHLDPPLRAMYTLHLQIYLLDVQFLIWQTLSTVWYHLYKFKNMKNTLVGVLILLKETLLSGFFSRYLNFANSAKLRKASPVSKLSFSL